MTAGNPDILDALQMLAADKGITDEELASIRCPALIVQANENNYRRRPREGGDPVSSG